MIANIIGEDEGDIGTEVVDNNNKEHQIEMNKTSGDIYAHACEAYADKARDRTPNENQYNEQARRYAKYYVYRERGYDTLEHTKNPDYVNAAREAIDTLSDEEFKSYFGTVHQQLQSHYDEDCERPIEIPAEAQDESAVVYNLDVYLDATHSEIADQPGIEFDQDTAESATEITRQDLSHWTRFNDPLIAYSGIEGSPPEISTISEIHVGYLNATGDYIVHRETDPIEREPDVTIELLPEFVGSLEEFRRYLEKHLRCHIRDCFVRTGVVPPFAFQLIGFGTVKAMRRYEFFDLYPLFYSHRDNPRVVFG